MFATNDALASGGMTNCWFRCGLTMFFLASDRLCCRWRARRCHAPRPGLRAAPASSVPGRRASEHASEGAGSGSGRSVSPRLRHRRYADARSSANDDASEPRPRLLQQMLAGSRDRIDAGFQRGGNPAVAPPIAGVRGVGFQQDTCLQQLPRGVLSLADHRVQLTTFLVAERHDVFLDRDLFPGHRIRSVVGAEPSSQRLTAESRTWGTRHPLSGAPASGACRRPTVPRTWDALALAGWRNTLHQLGVTAAASVG